MKDFANNHTMAIILIVVLIAEIVFALIGAAFIKSPETKWVKVGHENSYWRNFLLIFGFVAGVDAVLATAGLFGILAYAALVDRREPFFEEDR